MNLTPPMDPNAAPQDVLHKSGVTRIAMAFCVLLFLWTGISLASHALRPGEAKEHIHGAVGEHAARRARRVHGERPVAVDVRVERRAWGDLAVNHGEPGPYQM